MLDITNAEKKPYQRTEMGITKEQKALTTKDTKVHTGKPLLLVSFVNLRVLCG
jgi:hypothetical protein